MASYKTSQNKTALTCHASDEAVRHRSACLMYLLFIVHIKYLSRHYQKGQSVRSCDQRRTVYVTFEHYAWSVSCKVNHL